MSLTTGGPVGARVRFPVTVLMALGAAVVAGPAAAEPPQDLPEMLTDLAGAVQDEARVQAALDELADTTDLQLFVVYIDTFDGVDPADWADSTAQMSRLGTDDLLLVVAVEDSTYQLSVADELEITDAQMLRIEREAIVPALRDARQGGDWGAAAIAAADAYADAVTPTPFPAAPVVGGLGTLVLAGGGVVVWRRRRAAAAVRAELEALDKEASLALVAADDAVQRSGTEVGFAEAQFGSEAVAPFWAALDSARTELTSAFGLRQLLDDADPETDDERRVMLRRILEHCESVDATIDAKTAEIDELRDLWATAPERLAELRDRAQAVLGAVQTAESTLAGLTRTFEGPRLAEAEGSPADARTLAVEAAATAERGLASVDADRATAVHAARDAEDALGRAQALLDVVTALSVDLRDAPERIDAAIASLTDDLTDAARLGAGDPAIAAAETEARAALTEAAGQRTSGDPLGALDRLASAETALDALLEPRREHERLVQRAHSRLDTMLPELSRELTSVSAVISGNRSAVGSAARTRLSEAQRQADTAGSTRTVDPLAAVVAAETALRMLAEARRRSQSDIRAYRSRSTSSSWGGGYSSGWGGSGRSTSRSSSSRSSSSRSSSSRSSSSRRSSSSSRSSSRSSSSRSSGRRGGGGRF